MFMRMIAEKTDEWGEEVWAASLDLEKEEPEKLEETDEDLIERAEKDFYKVIETEKKVRETKHAESNKALQDAKTALESDKLPAGDEISEDHVKHDAIIEESE